MDKKNKNKEKDNINIETSKNIENNDFDNKKENNKNTKFNTIEVIAIMIITTLFGAFIGSVVTYFKDNNGIFGNNKNLKELISTYYDVVDNYYEKIDDDELLEAGIKGMIDYLHDPYSSYLSPTYSVSINEELEGQYIGLGAEVLANEEGNLVVKKVYEDSPAEKCGLKENDEIYKVDDYLTKEMNINEVTDIIKGKENTTAKLYIIREGKELELEFVREAIDLTSVTGEIIENNNKKIGLIKISIFAKNSYKQFEKVYKELEEKEITSLIIDIRDNNGGYLQTVKEICELFLKKKDTIFIVEDNTGKIEQKASKNGIINIPTVVLINSGSASSSEILASCLNENLGSDLIGVKTYGKGSIQKTKVLSSGATIKYTTQKWLTPSGKSIEGEGIEPTIEVEESEDYYKNPNKENDTQLQKAIEVLSNK